MQQSVTSAAAGESTARRRPGRAPASCSAPAPPTPGLLPAGPSCQPCPDCGGLECLCRPRFFAGQLLTEQDLNRLDQYIVAKNQLHNRYLVGHGVVCGLEVAVQPLRQHCQRLLRLRDRSLRQRHHRLLARYGGHLQADQGLHADHAGQLRALQGHQPVPRSGRRIGSCDPLQEDAVARRHASHRRVAMQLRRPRGVMFVRIGGQQGLRLRQHDAGRKLLRADHDQRHAGQHQPAAPRRAAGVRADGHLRRLSLRSVPRAAGRSGITTAPGARARRARRTIGGEMFERIACCLQDLLAVVPTLPTAATKPKPAQPGRTSAATCAWG